MVSGALLAACFPHYNQAYLVWIAGLPLLAALIFEPRLKRAYLLGALAGSVFLGASVYWFAGVMEHYGGMSPEAAIGVMALFLIVDSSYWGAFGLVVAWTARRSQGLGLLASPFLWVAMDLAQTYGYFGGFPWNLLGYGIQASGLRQAAAVTGVYGLSFLALASTALAAWALIEPSPGRRRLAQIALVAWVASLVITNRALQPPPIVEGQKLAILVQPNVPLNESAEGWAPWKNPGPLKHLVDLSLEKLQQTPPGAGAPLVVWSENSAPFYFDRDPVFRGAVERLAREARAYLIVGATNFVGGDLSKPLNSAIVLDPAGSVILQYDKIHLVPFGEYVPAWLGHWVGKITSEAGNFVPGSNYAPAPGAEGAIGVFICYEEIFPQLVRHLAPHGPGLLVNISDDAWYGDSSASYQTMEMARLRAVENRRYLLRATNDGITDIIDPYGRVLGTLPRHEQTVLAARFDYEGGETFYAGHGDVFAWLCVGVGVVVAAQAARRRI